MNKLLTKIVGVVLGTSMAVGVGTAVIAKNAKGISSEVSAAEEVYKSMSFVAANTSNSISSYTASATYTANGFSVATQNFSNNQKKWSNIRCGRKSDDSVATITTAAVIDEVITKVEITIDSINSTYVNSIKLYSKTADAVSWTVESTQYTQDTGAQSVSLSTPAANLLYQVEFDCAASGSNGFVQISAIKYYYNNSGPSLSVSPTSAMISKNGTQTLTATASGGNGGVSWTTSDSDVVSISDTSGLSITATGEGRGTATVTASYSTANDVVVSIQVTDVQHAGTAGDPYTVEDARDQIDLNTGLANVYASGIVSSIVEAYNSQYGNISYNISTDGSTESEQLEAYRGKGVGGANFTSADDIQVGDEVVVYGTLKKHNTTYEFDANNQLVSLNRPVPETFNISATITNGTSDAPATIQENGNVNITITPNSGYKLPTSVSVTGASYTYSAGVIALSNPTDDVVITATCPAATSYSITVTDSHCSHTGATSIFEDGEATITFTADSGYSLPATVTSLSGATQKTWNSSTGVLVIQNPTGNVSISMTAVTYTNSSSLTPGDYYIKYDTHYFTGSVSSGKGASSTSKPGDAGKFTFSLIGNDTWTIINASGNRLGISSNGTTSLFLGSNDSYTFKVINGTSGTYELQSLDFTNRYLAYYDSNSDFRTYTSGNTEMTLESAKTVSSFSVYSTGANKNVLKGSTFDAAAAATAGFQARLNYTDSTFDDVTASATWTLDTSSINNNATLTVTYESYPAVEITGMNIYVVTMTSLTINSSGAKTTGYWTGDTLDTTGLIITGHDSSSNDYPIAIGDCTFSPTTLTTAGNSITITVSYANEVGDPATGTYTVSVSEFAYAKATSINGGDKVFFTNSGETKYMSAISSTSTVYGIATAYEGKPGTDHVYTVVAGSSDGTVAFKGSDGKYLNWSTGNSLNTVSSITENSSWEVSFDGTVATITNAADDTRIIKWNNDRFATYSNNNAVNVTIWKLNGTSGQAAAETFATNFNKDIVNDICKVNDGSFDVDMAEAWELYELEYEELSSEAKAYIASKTANASGDVVEKMLYEYNHIYGSYGTSLSLSNFLGRTEAVKASARINPIAVVNTSNVATVMIVISVLAITTLGGYFLLRKRKEER